MDALSLEPVGPDDSNGSVPFQAGPGPVENSGAVPAGAVEVDVVPTSRWGPEWPGRPMPGHLGRNLKRGVEVARVRGFETKRELVRLHVFEGKSIPQCAKLMGRSYKSLHAVWRIVVAESCGDKAGPVDMRRNVRAFTDRCLRELVEVSIPLVGESAAHGAIILKATEALCKLHGVTAEDDADSGGGVASLEEIGASVRVVSPLLADKLERVKALGMGKVAEGFKVAKS